MRTNKYGFGIKTFGNREDVDFAIVHVMRDDNPFGKDVNGVVKPNGTIKWIDNLDDCRGYANVVYNQNKAALPKNYKQIISKAEVMIRSGISA